MGPFPAARHGSLPSCAQCWSHSVFPFAPPRCVARRRWPFRSRTNRDDAGGGRGGRGAPRERGRRRGRGDASRADQGPSSTGNRRMTRAPWPALGSAASRSGRGRTTMTLVMAAEAGARRRDVKRDGPLCHGHCWGDGWFNSNLQYSSSLLEVSILATCAQWLSSF